MTFMKKQDRMRVDGWLTDCLPDRLSEWLID